MSVVSVPVIGKKAQTARVGAKGFSVKTVVHTTDVDRGERRFRRRLRVLNGTFIKTGLHEDSGAYKDGTPVVLVGVKNEFGAEGVPQRSFVRATFDKNKIRWIKRSDRQLSKIALGATSVNRSLQALGFLFSRDMKKFVTELSAPPNAPSTIAMKGFDNPLIHTRRMHDNIKSKIHRGSALGGGVSEASIRNLI